MLRVDHRNDGSQSQCSLHRVVSYNDIFHDRLEAAPIHVRTKRAARKEAHLKPK